MLEKSCLLVCRLHFAWGYAMSTLSFDESTDRRRAPRTEVRQFGKLYHAPSGRFVPCVATNISTSGALLETRRPIPFKPGDQLKMGLSLHEQPVVLRSSDLFEIEVVRALSSTDGHHAIAIRFLDDQSAEDETSTRIAA